MSNASNNTLASLLRDGERATDPRNEALELDMGDVHTALSRAAGIDLHKLSLAMRAELQLAGHSPSGGHEALAARIIEKGLATKGFFFTLKQKGLLTKGEPLRPIISKQVEPLAELKAPPPSRLLATGPIQKLFDGEKVKDPIVQLINLRVIASADPNAPKKVKCALPQHVSVRPVLR
jgi:hypothetical protein